MAISNSVTLEKKLLELKKILGDMGSAMIAFSGGVDSTFLTSVAQEVLGKRAVAVTAVSPTYSQSEVKESQELAQEIGIRHILIETKELDNPSFAANDSFRCYHCKKELFGHLRQIAERERIQWVVDGSNRDDLGDYRPGRKVGEELGIRSPLCEAGFTKEDIRALSRERKLPTWNKPQLACLASRFPYGTPVTLDLLRRISQAEEYLHHLGFRQLRVRHHDNIARIEVEPQDIAPFMEEGTRAKVVEYFRSLGYTYVTLDLAGYRSGSMNEVLPLAKPEE